MPWSVMYLLIFMPKNLVVTNWPSSPYHDGQAYRRGSAPNAPGGCLSIPTAIPRSWSPRRMVLAASVNALAAVAHPLYTSVNGIPVRPSSATTASGLSIS